MPAFHPIISPYTLIIRYISNLVTIYIGGFMKKLLNVAGIYGLLALLSGVFFREYTKAFDFQGFTTISLTHVHLFVLGSLLFLILALYSKAPTLSRNKNFKRFMISYNIGLPFMVIMMYVRGITQVQNINLTHEVNAALSGIAGISHILVSLGLIFLFFALRKTLSESN